MAFRPLLHWREPSLQCRSHSTFAILKKKISASFRSLPVKKTATFSLSLAAATTSVHSLSTTTTTASLTLLHSTHPSRVLSSFPGALLGRRISLVTARTPISSRLLKTVKRMFVSTVLPLTLPSLDPLKSVKSIRYLTIQQQSATNSSSLITAVYPAGPTSGAQGSATTLMISAEHGSPTPNFELQTRQK
ncbi:hypothetical protein OIU79_006559 [Salix purpurea]|uniref:Uncharacterized protein n=1 Tax=Salix purpurea TaxID=77065 RepID=A0A9Q0TVX7_SALPP|nr:hypothetical protein OIU79_006559 [Salix purpurea]